MQRCINIVRSTVQGFYVQTVLMAVSALVQDQSSSNGPVLLCAAQRHLVRVFCHFCWSHTIRNVQKFDNLLPPIV